MQPPPPASGRRPERASTPSAHRFSDPSSEPSSQRTSQPASKPSTSQRIRDEVEQRLSPAVAAVRTPARLGWTLWIRSLRRDRRAQVGTTMAAALVAVGIVGGALRLGSPPAVVAPLISPSIAHLLGTDSTGRDVLRTLLRGALPSLGGGYAASLVAGILGLAIGTVAALFRGSADAIVHRLIEALAAAPSLLLLLALQGLFPTSGAWSMIALLALSRWPETTIVARAAALRALRSDHVVAARALGASPASILAKHVLPGVLFAALAPTAAGVGAVIGLEAALGVLGLGHLTSDAWGALLADAHNHPTAWWLFVGPSLPIAATAIASSLVGDSVRDTLDPHLRHILRNDEPLDE